MTFPNVKNDVGASTKTQILFVLILFLVKGFKMRPTTEYEDSNQRWNAHSRTGSESERRSG